MDIPDIQTISVLAGIFFLFIALIGGGLTIREVVIPKIPKLIRVLVFFLGLILVFFWPIFWDQYEFGALKNYVPNHF